LLLKIISWRKKSDQLIYGKGRSAYRILFTITGDIVQILFVRHVAQKPLSSQEDEEE
jgi:hypothetical protein